MALWFKNQIESTVIVIFLLLTEFKSLFIFSLHVSLLDFDLVTHAYGDAH